MTIGRRTDEPPFQLRLSKLEVGPVFLQDILSRNEFGLKASDIFPQGIELSFGRVKDRLRFGVVLVELSGPLEGNSGVLGSDPDR